MPWYCFSWLWNSFFLAMPWQNTCSLWNQIKIWHILAGKERKLSRRFLINILKAWWHAQHPNYMGKHERNHSPKLNAGVVVKSNSNQRYCTNAATGFLVRELTRKAGIAPPQEFVVRNDCPCGSTIGPILSSNTGIRTVDAGMPQLSMHSCREVMGVIDRKFTSIY